MQLKLRVACAALLAANALPALALQLGEIQVKSALNQPLVAAIAVHPDNLAELDGLTVGLAPEADFARAGLTLTATDRTLRFHVATDNNGQKLILVTSSEPITDPYLDFLVQVNTREGKQVQEFVALLNPVIAAPVPVVEAAPATGVAGASTSTVAQAPAAVAGPRQETALAAAAPPQPAATPRAPSFGVNAGAEVTVKRGDTLYSIARVASQGTGNSVDQMMLALQAANRRAFFGDNINNLKAGAILRLPTRDELDRRTAAAAAAEVRRQSAAWNAARPGAATLVAGRAAAAAARAVPRSAPNAAASDHLTLTPPTGKGGGTTDRPGVAGGTGTAAVGLAQPLQAGRDTLVSLEQSNADLESRVRELKDIAAKSDKLLSLKDATIAELQAKLAVLQRESGTPAGSSAKARMNPVAPHASARAAAALVQPAVGAAPWYARPVAWIVAALVALALIALGWLGWRRRTRPGDGLRGPLADPGDVAATPPVGEASGGFPDPDGVVFQDDPADVATDGGAAVIDDPVDGKLDLARAYLDLGEAARARAVLAEVMRVGSRVQQDEATRLLAGVAD